MLTFNTIEAAILDQVSKVEATNVKVIRNNHLVVKEMRHRKKRKMTSKLKMALQKAQRASHSNKANKRRQKSMETRQRLIK